MKKLLAILLLPLLSPAFSFAQTDYKVVFDLTTKDTIDHKNVLRWINEISKADPKAKLEVVFYGKSLDLVVKDRSIQPELLTTLAANKNIAFKVCKVAMKANNVEKGQLLAGVQTVPDGIFEIISKQKEGWGYIKVSH
jgi:uncharacterized protein